MMHIKNPIIVDDAAVLQTMSANPKLTSSFGKLSVHASVISNAYIEYVMAQGNPWKLSKPLTLTGGLDEALRSHYKNEVSGLEFISKIRDELCIASCPMCGSTLPPGTVDHVIPKDVYPEFSFFSRNLVSACDCNNGKGSIFKGKNPDERFFHPYFDKILDERLVCIGFGSNVKKPDLSIKLIAPHDSNKTLKFHVKFLLAKTAVLTHADNSWGFISDQPGLDLSIKPIYRQSYTMEMLVDELKQQVELHDKKHKNVNNWQSMFYFGLLQSPIHLGHLLKRLKDGH